METINWIERIYDAGFISEEKRDALISTIPILPSSHTALYQLIASKKITSILTAPET